MEEQQAQNRGLGGRLKVRTLACGACVGAAVLAIIIALIAMTTVTLLLGALGADSAPHSLSMAIQDAVVALYAVQLVGITFFNHTAELRFAAIPGLLLLGLSIIAATIVTVRTVSGSARRRLTVALTMPIPYALFMGLAGLFIPMRFTVPGFGGDIPVSASPVEACLLPLVWGLLFASIGGLIGVFGSDWRRAASRLLGAWAIPLGTSLRVLAASLVAGTVIALIGGLALVGGDLTSVVSGGFGHAVKVVGVAVVALPTFAAAVLVSGFGVPFDWQVDALSHGNGSISAYGGTLPSSGAHLSQAQGAPAVFVLAPVIALAAVLAIGWLSARRSAPNYRLCLANSARAATLTTIGIWLLALLARVDAQAGGLLGFHLAPDAGALLWRVPLATFLGCFAGSIAYVLTRGVPARRQLAMQLTTAFRPSSWTWRPSGLSGLNPLGQGLSWRAALGLGLVSLPVMLVGTGATGTATSAGPPQISLAPISEAAEQRLERASTEDKSVSVTVDPETRVLGTASVHTPLGALGIAADASRSAKARGVVDRYGDLFGLSNPTTELGNTQVSTNGRGGTQVSFTQMANGLPIFGGGVGVHFSHNGGLLSFLSGSVIPELSVTEDGAKLSSDQAIEVAEKALPSGSLARPASLEVYAGLPPYISGPNARLAWFVWLIGEDEHASNEYVVDAVTGKILDVIPKADSALVREIYDAKKTAKLPGTLVRTEGKAATGDADTDSAYDHSGDVYEFYSGFIGADSYDNKGAKLISTVHLAQASGAPYENAYWNGKQMVFGNGYPKALDIVGHELTHAYTEHTSGLVESGQSGALNESLSDIMGVTIEMNKTKEVDWQVGEDLPEGGGPIRNLAKPGEFHELAGAGDNHPDPAKLAEWVATCLDNLGVHINSTITSHAFYLAAVNISASLEVGIQEAAEVTSTIFYLGFTEYLKGNPTATLEDARAATLKAAEEYLGKGSQEYKAIEAAFGEVGLNGSAQPSEVGCPPIFECSFARALKAQQGISGASAAAMLATLYKARGELAFPSAAGKHFLPLYEEHMGRITELVSADPTLAETSVEGLAELTPALEALMEGEGDRFRLSGKVMAKIEAALKRLAQDDRLFGGEGAGELAELIGKELRWLNLPSYSGKTYEEGWTRLNEEVKAQSLLEEGGPIIDPNCTGHPYNNGFQVNGFYVDTPGHRIPGQVAPLNAGGVICGAEVEATGGTSGCVGENTLNTKVTAQLPPGEKVNSTKNLPNGSWVGELIGRGIVCAGNETQILYGQAGLLSLSSWTSAKCPTTALACFEGRSTFENENGPTTGKDYAWVIEEGGVLSLVTRPLEMTVETPEGFYEVQMSFGQFETHLCARAGSAASQECGGVGATWIHQNGEASEGGCPEGKGRFTVQAENAGGETTLPAYACALWEGGARMQTVGAPNSLNAVSCVPATTSCVTADSKGGAFYATNVSASSAASWKSWTGPGVSPSHAVECPSSTLCLLAAGEVSGGGGNLYRATSLGGEFLTSFKPTNGVGAISCPSASFCVTGLEGGGFIRYSTNPSGIIWTSVSIGSGAMKDVSCLSASFCAAVDASGSVHVAVTEKGVKEAAGWTATKVNGETALRAIACSSTSSCVALDGTGEVLNLAIEASGKATVKRQALAGAGELNEVTCNGSSCVAVDDEGGLFASANSGASWTKRFATAGNATSVSCASAKLCASVDTSGDVAMFNPE